MTTIRRIAVGMSGGLDSAVATYLLKQQGFEVLGLTMRTWDGTVSLEGSGRPGCYGPGEAQDIEAARAIAASLDIPHFVVPLAAQFKAEVLDYFRQEYLAGRTPNPCVRCNRRVKLGLLPERARAQGIEFDAFATGHYARVIRDADRGRCLLLRGRDPGKDQSYFLSYLTQAQLGQLVLPLGDYQKEGVRRIAAQLGWDHLVRKAESQDFIESDGYGPLFGPEEARPGPIVDQQGRVVGQHSGIIHYTVGQRRGLRIGGSPRPLYVTAIDAKANAVRVGDKQDLYRDRLIGTCPNWIAFEQPPAEPLRATAKVRQQHGPAAARLAAVQVNGEPAVEVVFDEPQLAITPGQIVAFYDADVVLGAATIL